MKLNASAVKEKLQTEKDCVVYVYLNGGNFAYDTELKVGCIAKISSLQMNEKRSKINIHSETKLFTIVDRERVSAYTNYQVIQDAVIEIICINLLEKHERKYDILPSDTLQCDIPLDSLDRIEVFMSIEKRMGISISDAAIERYFDRPETTVEDVCRCVHQWIN